MTWWQDGPVRRFRHSLQNPALEELRPTRSVSSSARPNVGARSPSGSLIPAPSPEGQGINRLCVVEIHSNWWPLVLDQIAELSVTTNKRV